MTERRKNSMERKPRQNAPSERASAASVGMKHNVPQETRIPGIARASGERNAAEKPGSKLSKAMEISVPKTRFTVRDACRDGRSSSLPRLHGFPPEQIRKPDGPAYFLPGPVSSPIPERCPRPASHVPSSSSRIQNYGQGDAGTTVRFSQQCHQQQDAPKIHQQQVVPQRGFPVNSNSMTVPQGPCGSNGAIPEEGQVESHCEETILDSGDERQPVGGRNAALHRLTIAQADEQRRQKLQFRSEPPANFDMNDRSNDNYLSTPNVPYNPPGQTQTFPSSNHEHFCQIHQEPHCDTVYRQEMQQRANNQRLIMNGQQYFYNLSVPAENCCSPGMMTSPQDAVFNRCKREILARSEQSPPVLYQSNWAERNDAVRNNYNAVQSNCNAVRQLNCGEWQVEAENRQSQLLRNLSAGASPGKAIHRDREDQRRLTNQNGTVYAPDNSGKQMWEKRILRFTPDMIRDQEMLVSAMKQQEIPEDIMKRQFDALLNEQRKYLRFLEQMQEEIPEVRTSQPVTRKRRESDEKPEWMIHITPPRLSYTQRTLPEENPRPGERNNGRLVHYQNRRNDQQISPQFEQRIQQCPRGFCQGTENSGGIVPPVCASTSYQFTRQCDSLPRNHTANEYPNCVYNPACTAQQHQHHQHISAYQYSPAPTRPVYQCQEFYQNEGHCVGTGSAVAKLGRDSPRTYEDLQRTSEPCSLLKMKIYKEVIRPQKRNNGLQDLETARRLVEIMKNSENARNLNYPDGRADKTCRIKLNGIQDPDVLCSEIERRPPVEPQRRISANGLENSRNPDNPQPPPRRLVSFNNSNRETVTEYPVQRQNNRSCYDIRHEKQTVPRTQSSENYPIPVTNRIRNQSEFGFHRLQPDHCQEYHQYLRNAKNITGGGGDVSCLEKSDKQENVNLNCNGDAPTLQADTSNGDCQVMQNKVAFQPGIQEARIIGGITYLARKPSYVPEPYLSATPNIQPTLIQ